MKKEYRVTFRFSATAYDPAETAVGKVVLKGLKHMELHVPCSTDGTTYHMIGQRTDGLHQWLGTHVGDVDDVPTVAQWAVIGVSKDGESTHFAGSWTEPNYAPFFAFEIDDPLFLKKG